MSHAALLSQAGELNRLSFSGIAVMIGCIGFVLALAGFCFWRLLRETQPSEHHHAPLDIDTRDTDS